MSGSLYSAEHETTEGEDRQEMLCLYINLARRARRKNEEKKQTVQNVFLLMGCL